MKGVGNIPDSLQTVIRLTIMIDLSQGLNMINKFGMCQLHSYTHHERQPSFEA